MENLIKALIDSDQATSKLDAMSIISEMSSRVIEGEDPEIILEEYNLEPDFIQDLIDFASGTNSSKKQPKPNLNSKDDSIMVKIAMLLEKANNTDSLEERDAFMAGAQKLMLKHNLDSERILAVKGGIENGVMEENIIEERIKYEEIWDRDLVVTVLKNNMCEYLYNTHMSQVIVIGKESNVNIVCSIFVFYRNAIINLATGHFNGILLEIKEMNLPEKVLIAKKKQKQTFLRDYLSGAVAGLTKLLEGKIEEFIQAPPDAENESCTGIILSRKDMIRNNRNRIHEYISSKYPNLGYARLGTNNANTSSGAYKKGMSDAGSIKSGGNQGRKMLN